MSAQIIRALRKRATELLAQSPRAAELSQAQIAAIRLQISDEFRRLADEAEAR